MTPAASPCTSVSGSYAISATKTRDDGCNFSASFAGTVEMGCSPSNELTIRMIERQTRVYAGTVQPTGAFQAAGTGDLGGFAYNGQVSGQVSGASIQGTETLNFTTGCPGRTVIYEFTGSRR